MYLNVTELNELIYSLGVAEQCEKDKIEHDMNFKRAYYRMGEF